MRQTIDNKHFERLLAIWEHEFGSGEGEYMPLVPIVLESSSLLFVGLNPSFSSSVIRRLLPAWEIEPDEYYLWKNRSEFDPRFDIDLHIKAKQEYAYFGRFRRLSKILGDIKWDHTDLFFYRETSQKRFRSLVLENNKIDRLTKFGRAQIEIAFEMIACSTPKCIVVSNALASDIYKKHHDLSFSNSQGSYIQTIRGQKVPVFLSSMLTGQRALDKYSFERLAWHLGKELGISINHEQLNNPLS